MSTGARRIPEPLLECYLVGSLDAKARAEVEALLAKSQVDRARLAELRAESVEFLVRYPAGPLVNRFEASQLAELGPEENDPSEMSREPLEPGPVTGMGARRILEPILECYLVGSLDTEARAEVEAVLSESEADRARLAELQAESMAFLSQHSPAPLVSRFEASLWGEPGTQEDDSVDVARVIAFPSSARNNEPSNPKLVPISPEEFGGQAVALDLNRGNDFSTIAELYRRHAASLYSRAKVLLNDGDEAFDVVQEAFLAMAKLSGQVENGLSSYTLIFQLVTNRAIERLRKRSRWSGRLVQSFEKEAEQDGARVDEMNRVEVAMDLALLTRDEPPEVLTAAMLYFVEGHTAAAVGSILNLPRMKVQQMLTQFMKRARARMTRLDKMGRE